MPFHLLSDDVTKSEFAAFTPDNFETLSSPPLLVFLHGSGERGWDPGVPLTGIAHIFENLQLPAAVIFPQCDWDHRAFYGEMEERAMNSIEKAALEFGTDANRIFLAGYSMGGSSSLWLSAKYPQKFVGIICIAPGITWMGEEAPPKLPNEDEELFNSMFVAENRTENIAKHISNTPIWFLQGTADEPCPIEETRSLVSELRKIGVDPIVTEYDGVDHDSLGLALEQEGLFDWLFAL